MTGERQDPNAAPHAAARHWYARPALLMLIVGLVTAAAAAAITSLHRQVDDSRHIQIELMEIQAHVHHLVHLQWRAVTHKRLSSAWPQEIDKTQRRVERTLDELERVHPTVQELRSLEKTYHRYSSAAAEEFRLLAAGRAAQAQKLDAETVDPLFTELTESISRQAAAQQRTAAQREHVVDYGAILIVTAAFVLVVWLLRAADRARQSASVAATEKRVTEQSEARLKSLLEHSIDVILILAPDTTVSFVTDSARTVFACEPEEILGSGFLDRVHADDVATVQDSIEKCLADPLSAPEAQFRFRHNYGGWRYFEATCANQLDDPNIAGILLNARDITDRRRVWKALEESEGRYRRIIETAGEGVWVMDTEHRTTFVNKQMAKMLGCRPEDMVAIPPTDFVPEEELKDHEARMQHRRAGRTESYDRRLRRSDGSVIWCHVNATPIMDEAGGFAGSFAMFTDISEHRWAEETLQASEECFRTSTENMLDPFGIYAAVRDESGNIVDFRVEYVNPAACIANQMTKEEQVGKSLLELLPTHRESGLFDDYCRVVETGEPLVKDSLTYTDLCGKKQLARAFDIRVARLGDGFIAVWRDITERKKAEETIIREKLLGDAIVDNIPAGVAFLDNNFVLRKCNRAYEDLIRKYTPYSPKEARGMSYFDYVPGSRPQVEAWFQNVRDTGQVDTRYGFELVIQRNGQEEKTYWDTSVAPVPDPSGKGEGILILTQDVTERKEAEALSETTERLRQVVQEMPIWMAAFNSERVPLAWNREAERISGYSAKKMIGNPRAEEMLFPDKRYRAEMRRRQTEMDRDYRNWELAIATKSGDKRVVSFSNISGKYPIPGWANWTLGVDMTEQVQARRLSDTLNTINLTLNSSLDFDQTMKRVIVDATTALECDAAMLVLRQRDGWKPKYVSGLPPEVLRLHFADDEIGGGALHGLAQPIVAQDVSRDDRFNTRLLRKWKVCSLLGVSIGTEKAPTGGLGFFHLRRPKPFSEAQVDFSRKLAALVGLALRNTQLYQSEHRIAQTLQESLVQPVPRIAGLDIGVVYGSAYEKQRVGGDFYDVFELGTDTVAVLIGDVSGKGVEAAGMTETIRSAVRTLAHVDPSPAKVLTRLNRSLLSQVPVGDFATGTFLILDKKTRNVEIASAGHPRPLVWGPKTRSVRVATGMLLGAFPATYRQSRITLNPDESIVLYTDGLLEARRDSEMFGQERLLAALANVGSVDPQAAADALLGSATDFAEGRLKDDVAVVVLRIAD